MCLRHKWKKWFYDSNDCARGHYRYCKKCGKEQYLNMSWAGHDWEDITDDIEKCLLKSLLEF